jgi:hypothetical protein
MTTHKADCSCPTCERETIAREAIEFLGTNRGRLIVGQALAIAVEKLESVEPAFMQERSNIEDMKFLIEHLFPMGAALHHVQKQARSGAIDSALKLVKEEA